jgi:hypothetical protein
VVGNRAGETSPEEEAAISPQAEMVCRVFRGTVV